MLKTPPPAAVEISAPVLTSLTAPLGGVLLAVLALWLSASPPLHHTVALDVGDVACAIDAGSTRRAVHTVVIHDDGHLSWNGMPVADDAELARRLSGLHTTPPETADVLDIRPQPAADYGRFVKVLAAAQRHGVVDVGIHGQRACTPRRID